MLFGTKIFDGHSNLEDLLKVMDVSETKNAAVLARSDMAEWHATYEAPLSFEYYGWTVHKTQAWSQGPVLLQALAILSLGKFHIRIL